MMLSETYINYFCCFLQYHESIAKSDEMLVNYCDVEMQ